MIKYIRRYGTPELWDRVFRGIGYLLIGTGAIWLLGHPPSAMASALGFWLTIVWCSFVLTSIPAAFAVWIGDFTTEYILLPFFTGALVIASLWGWTRLDDDPTIGTRVMFISALAFVLVARWFKIHHLVQRPISGGTPLWRQKLNGLWTGIRLRH